MGGFTHHGKRSGSRLAIAATVLVVAAYGDAGQHPSLIDPTTTNCTECHEHILAGAVQHAPAADDCLSCHDFEKTDDRSAVTLTAGGAELCLACHDTMTAAARGSLQTPHVPVVDDCSGCHDPHSSSESHLLLQPPRVLCSSCHDLAETDSVHAIPVSRADCLTCHSPHGSDAEHMLNGSVRHLPFEEGSCEGCHRTPRGTKVRLLLEGSRLCYACHTDLEQRFTSGSVHSAVSEGMCIGCHDPHLADRPKLLKAPGEELCYRCHPQIQAKSTTTGAHAALDEGCDGCHDPHQSEHRAQLLDDPIALCIGCHDTDDEDLALVHLGADLRRINCVECHDPHGSSEPHLIASGSVHPPFVEDCGSCHQGEAGRLVAGGGVTLCYACHSEIQQVVQTAPVQHPAMETGECVDCHSPHASNQPKLLRSEGGGVCTTCHEEQRPGPGELSHGATEWLGCQSCHLAHGGTQDHLLRATGNTLCLGCHLEGEVRIDPSGVAMLPGGFVLDGVRAESLTVVDLDPLRERNHPILNHPVAGMVRSSRRAKLPKFLTGREMTCLSCHVPHTAPTRQLLAFGAESRAELCTACHTK